MSTIRAFVGHSFAKQDAEVVEQFLKFFDTIAKLGIGFSWDHAQDAEPKEVAAKVLELIEDKNTFIGICTKKELVIDRDRLQRPMFRKEKFVSDETNYYWKASDWLIQEIGLAIGRRLKIILLVEAGIRSPGNFQGNLEYIEFDRNSLSSSFDRILQMIKSISPHNTALVKSNSEQVAKVVVEDAPRKREKNPKPVSPRATWSNEQFEFALFKAILFDDKLGIAKLDATYRKTQSYREATDGGYWDARIEATRIASGKNGDLNKLKALVEVEPVTAQKLDCLAIGYSGSEFHSKAAGTYERAFQLAKTPNLKTTYLARAAQQYAKDDKREEMERVIQLMRGLGSNEERILNTIKECEKQFGDKDTQIAAMERLLELSPQNEDMRFSLAYLYSQQENKDLSLYHYEMIPFGNRSGAAWNNIGVAFERLKMPVRAVRAYKLAAQKNETLAMSNLASKYMSEGFFEEAQLQLNEALKIADRHENVASTMVRMTEMNTQEEKTETELKSKVRPLLDFNRALGHAAALPQLGIRQGKWKGPDCELTIASVGNRFRAVGNYEVKASALAAGLLNPFAAIAAPRLSHDTYKVNYSGKIIGRMIVGDVVRGRQDGAKVSLLGGDTETRAMMYVSEDGGSILVSEKTHDGSPKFYQLTAVKE